MTHVDISLISPSHHPFKILDGFAVKSLFKTARSLSTPRVWTVQNMNGSDKWRDEWRYGFARGALMVLYMLKEKYEIIIEQNKVHNKTSLHTFNSSLFCQVILNLCWLVYLPKPQNDMNITLFGYLVDGFLISKSTVIDIIRPSCDISATTSPFS